MATENIQQEGYKWWNSLTPDEKAGFLSKYSITHPEPTHYIIGLIWKAESSSSPVPEDVSDIAKDYADDYVERQGSHDRPDITHHDFTKGFLAGHAYKGQHGGIPLSIIEELEKANPYNEKARYPDYHGAWNECVSKLRELLQSQPK